MVIHIEGNLMKLETQIKSIKAEILENKLILQSDTSLKVISSAVLNGGLQKVKYIMKSLKVEG